MKTNFPRILTAVFVISLFVLTLCTALGFGAGQNEIQRGLFLAGVLLGALVVAIVIAMLLPYGLDVPHEDVRFATRETKFNS